MDLDSVERERLFDTVVGTVTLRAADLGLVRDFYERALGLAAADADRGIELSDAEGRTLIRLVPVGSAPLTTPHTGLFHTAFRYPGRAALGAAVVRAMAARPEYQGASDHGVSEAVYIADPEGNGIELYRDRPPEDWPAAESGKVGMFSHPLDLEPLLEAAAARDEDATCDVGHIHLMTADVDRANDFWHGLVGLDERQRFGPSATFLAEGPYHHHLGANTWQSAGAPPAPADRPGLDSFQLRLRSADAVDAAAERLESAGHDLERRDGAAWFRDPDSNRVELTVR